MFSLGDQIIFGFISVLQDAFSKNTYDKNDFMTGKVSSNENFEFVWKNNQQIAGSLSIVEKEEFDEQNLPQILVNMTGGQMRNMSFDQFMEPIISGGKQIGEMLGGSGEFDMVIRCAAESTAQRRKLSDRAMANCLVNRDLFRRAFGVTVDSFRLGGNGETPYLNGDKRIYWQEITAHCMGEWEFPIHYKFDNTKISGIGRFGTTVANLEQIIRDTQISRLDIEKSFRFLWNVD